MFSWWCPLMPGVFLWMDPVRLVFLVKSCQILSFLVKSPSAECLPSSVLCGSQCQWLGSLNRDWWSCCWFRSLCAPEGNGSQLYRIVSCAASSSMRLSWPLGVEFGIDPPSACSFIVKNWKLCRQHLWMGGMITVPSTNLSFAWDVLPLTSTLARWTSHSLWYLIWSNNGA